tara:strand:+ start:216 stop:593 length:378 start_codon:yes stop_codon:yes gene_type:complete
MMIDQEWAIENIDIIMKYFTLLNKSENSSNRSRDKKKMEIDCDTVRYRAYYYLARDEEKRKMEKAKSIADRKRHAEDQAVRSMNDEMTARCIDLLKNQLLVKDKQIAFMKKMMESTVFSIEAETR